MKCNLNPTNYILTALVMLNVAGTHTRTKPITRNFTHTGKVISPKEKMWVLRADLNDATEDIYLL